MTKKTFDAAALHNFTGSQEWYRHSLNRQVLYTEGVQYLAEHAGAYWLVDEIALAQKYVPTLAKEEFQAWTLKVTNNPATLTCEDGNDNALFSKHIEFTDFPMDEVLLYVEGEPAQRTILLPSEH